MTYNFEKVQDAEYCCEMCFLDNVVQEYKNLNPDEYESVVIVAKDYLAQDLFRTLSSIQCECGEYLFKFGFAEIDNHEYRGEYLLSICADGSISLEQMVTDDGVYLSTEGKIVFIHEDCHYKAIERLNDGYNNIVIFGFEEEDNDWDEED